MSCAGGAIIQIQNSHNTQRQRVPENIPVEAILTISSDPVSFSQTLDCNIPRNCDEAHSFYAHVRVAPLPTGYTWKPNLFARLIKSAHLIVGGQNICSITSECLMVKLHTGLLMLPNKVPVSDRFIANRPSSVEQEFCIPLFLKDETGLSLTLIALRYHSAKIRITFSPFEELILPSNNGVPTPPIITCRIQETGNYYHNKGRYNMARAERHLESVSMIQAYTIYIPIRENDDTISLNIKSHNIHAAAFIHITDEHGLEILGECVDSIQVLFNDNIRYELSGYEAKYMQRTQIPWHIKDNLTSENIYFLSYWLGRQFSEGNARRPLGANFSRMDSIIYKIKLRSTAPPRVRVTLAHDTQNTFYVADGMGRMQYANEYSIRDINQRSSCRF